MAHFISDALLSDSMSKVAMQQLGNAAFDSSAGRPVTELLAEQDMTEPSEAEILALFPHLYVPNNAQARART